MVFVDDFSTYLFQDIHEILEFLSDGDALKQDILDIYKEEQPEDFEEADKEIKELLSYIE